jgi:Fur family ferric uptake transcriptional regulator
MNPATKNHSVQPGQDPVAHPAGRKPAHRPRLPMRQADTQGAKQRFLDFLAQKKLRLTAQRQAIVDTAFGTDQHFTADQLLAWSRKRDPSVSRATVYRTLPLLTESGLVGEMDFGRDRKFYDPNYAEHPFHNHIICQECEMIVEFESEKLQDLEKDISQRLGFSAQGRRLQIIASCDDFRRLGVCKRRDPE